MTASSIQNLLNLLAIDHPIIQAPMAGISTPVMAACVANAGGLGSIGVGAGTAAGAGEMIEAFRKRSSHSLNVNVFCHQPAEAAPAREAAWLARHSKPLAPPRLLHCGRSTEPSCRMTTCSLCW